RAALEARRLRERSRVRQPHRRDRRSRGPSSRHPARVGTSRGGALDAHRRRPDRKRFHRRSQNRRGARLTRLFRNKFPAFSKETTMAWIQLLITAFLAVLFLQSGLDKVVDRDGNTAFLRDHFQTSPLAGQAE